MDSRLLALKLFKTKSADVASGLSERSEIDFGELAVTILLKFIDVLEAAVIIVLGIFLVRIAKRYLQKIEATHDRQRTALNLLEKITSGFLLVVTFTLALKVVGLDLTLIVGVLTLGLSFGMRDVIKNYVAGILVLFKSPFEIGDIVKIRSYTGKIEKIEFQSITVRTFDQKEITIHNSDLLTQPITNFSKSQFIRLELLVPLGFGSDVGRALKIFDRILQNHSAVLKTPLHSIVFRQFNENGMMIYIRFWVQRPCNPLKIRSDLALQIQEAFDEEKVLAPYARETEPKELFGMTEARKERLKLFYAQPMLADIVAATAEQIAAAAQPAAEYADAEEPE